MCVAYTRFEVAQDVGTRVEWGGSGVVDSPRLEFLGEIRRALARRAAVGVTARETKKGLTPKAPDIYSYGSCIFSGGKDSG